MDPDQDHAVDGVGARHERGVQDARDLGDHLEADEGRQHEDGQVLEDAVASRRLPPRLGRRRPPPAARPPSGCSRSTRCRQHAGAEPRSRRPSPAPRRRPRPSRASRFGHVAGVEEAGVGGHARRRVGHADDRSSPPRTTSRPASVSSQLPPESAARSMTHRPRRPCRRPSPAVTSTGARRPGTAAVVITTSDAATSAARALLLAGQLVGGQLAGVAAGPLGADPEVDEGGPEALGLLLGRRPHVVGPDHAPPGAGRWRWPAGRPPRPPSPAPWPAGRCRPPS